MAVEDVRVRARRELEQAGISMESASFIVGDRPTGGWDALATKDDLSAMAQQLRLELQHELRHLERWMATTIIASLSVAIGAMAVIGAALRFA